jgi:hypothetical protein
MYELVRASHAPRKSKVAVTRDGREFDFLRFLESIVAR